MKLYRKLAKYYDIIYSDTFERFHKNYANFVLEAWRKFCTSSGRELLEVACGTGELMKMLKTLGFDVSGLDVNEEMIKIARKKIRARFYVANMRDFSLDKSFDVVVCAFTSMNYNLNRKELEKTLKNFYKHLKRGGIVIFDMPSGKFLEKRIGSQWLDVFECGDLKIARISQMEAGERENTVKNVMVYFFKERGKVDFEIDIHEHGLFSVKEVKNVMKKLGFKKVYVFGNLKFGKHKANSNRAFFVGVR